MTSSTPSPQQMTDLLAAWSDARTARRSKRLLPLGARAAPPRAPLHEPRAPRPHAPDLRARQRGLPQARDRRACAGRTARTSSPSPRRRCAASSSTTRARTATRTPRRRLRARSRSTSGRAPLGREGRRAGRADEALLELEKVDPRKARVVEMRYFGGLSAEEAAEVLKVSPDTSAASGAAHAPPLREMERK